jgi:hypothetical protein
MNSLAPEQTGAGSAVNDVTREIGGTLGVALLGSVLSSVYTTGVGDKLDASGLPPEAIAASKESVMAGVQAAAAIPGQGGQQMLEVIRDAFVDGLHASVIAAVVAAGLAAPIAWITLRDKPLGDAVVAEEPELQAEYS